MKTALHSQDDGVAIAAPQIGATTSHFYDLWTMSIKMQVKKN